MMELQTSKAGVLGVHVSLAHSLARLKRRRSTEVIEVKRTCALYGQALVVYQYTMQTWWCIYGQTLVVYQYTMQTWWCIYSQTFVGER